MEEALVFDAPVSSRDVQVQGQGKGSTGNGILSQHKAG